MRRILEVSKINPFKDSNLNDLQQGLSKFVNDRSDVLKDRISAKWVRFLAWGRERITIMFIPHSEKKIINFQASIFFIAIFATCVTLTILITSILIAKHSSTVKEISILKSYGSNSKLQIQTYKDEINKLHAIFKIFKPEITHLYSLTPGSNIDTLWAVGGVPNHEASDGDSDSPSMEELYMQEIESELKMAKEIMSNIKDFLKNRKKIIEDTPSMWPSKGYIVSRYAQKNSIYAFRPEFYSGIYIETFPGTEIVSTAPGVVEDVRWDFVLGLTVSVKHKYGFITSYSGCQRVSVEPGQRVSKGEVIGFVGKTGKTAKYACYYQIKIGTEFVDPVPYLNRIIQ